MKNDLDIVNEVPNLSLYDPEEFFDNQILTVRGLARLIKYSTKTVYKLAKNGTLPSKKVGKEYRFLLPEVLEALKKGN